MTTVDVQNPVDESRRGAVRIPGPPPISSAHAVHLVEPESLWARHGQLVCAIAAGLLLLIARIVAWSTAAPHGLAVNLLVGSAFCLGFYFGAIAAVESLRARKLDINLLMVLGAVLAIFVGSAAEGALLLFLFTLSGALEHYAMQRTHAALESLIRLFPREAIVLDDSASGTGEGTGQRRVKLEDLQVGDHILIKPGEHIAADGQVIEGISAVDESAITGEFLPREKRPSARAGEPEATVFAGTLNTTGRLVVRVARPAKDTTLAKIIHLVSQAREEKAPVERLFDRVGTIYTLAVLSVSAVACLTMGLVLGIPWLSVRQGDVVVETGAFYRAITLLIVASPCALIISTPVVILSAIASCARRGIVLKGGRHLESLAAMKALVFDKTGTLTTGQVRMVGVEVIETGRGNGTEPVMAHPEHPTNGAGRALQHCAVLTEKREQFNPDLRQRMLCVAMSLEANSTHPLAGAVVRAAQAEGLESLAVEEFMQEAGQGIRGRVNGQACIIGSPALLAGLCHTVTLERIQARIDQAHGAGETAVVLFYAGHAAVLRFSDTLRENAAQVIAEFHALGIRPLVMLTGDHTRVAQAVGQTLGLDEVRAELLPEDKLVAVSEMVGRYQAVGMVGDGINDAPALARATVGIAMGTIGSEAAMQAADVVLLSDAIDRLPWLVKTARRARRVMAQNLSFALGVILILVVCSLAGVVGLSLGVVGHEGSTLLVVINGLRLLLPPGAASSGRLGALAQVTPANSRS